MSGRTAAAPRPGGILVSGGSDGIGRAIALDLAARGWPVTAFAPRGRQPGSLAEGPHTALAAEARDRGLDLTLEEADVADEADVARVVAAAESRHGRLWGLVNNAAIGPLGSVLDTGPDLFDRILAVNLRGPYLCARACLPGMIAAGGGAIVNIGSGAGWGKPNMAAYATSKGGLFAFSAALALDHFHQGIRVNTVVPGGGGIVSGMSLGRVGGARDRLGAGAPGSVAGRPVAGEDVAASVAFLLSDEAATISGTVIHVGCMDHQGAPVQAAPAAGGRA